MSQLVLNHNPFLSIPNAIYISIKCNVLGIFWFPIRVLHGNIPTCYLSACTNRASFFFLFFVYIFVASNFFLFFLLNNNFFCFEIFKTRLNIGNTFIRWKRYMFHSLICVEMCEGKRISLISSKNDWHKLFTHRLQNLDEKSHRKQRRNYLVFRHTIEKCAFVFGFVLCPFWRKYGFGKIDFDKSIVVSAGSLWMDSELMFFLLNLSIKIHLRMWQYRRLQIVLVCYILF